MIKPESGEALRTVMGALCSSPDLVVAGGIERVYLPTNQWPDLNNPVYRTLDVYTYPQVPIYSAIRLNGAMSGLTQQLGPDLRPVSSTPFEEGTDELQLGVLRFEERIGRVSLVASVELDAGMGAEDMSPAESKWQATQKMALMQRTVVRVFPDIGHLYDAAEDKNVETIPYHELGRSLSDGRNVAALLESPMLNMLLRDEGLKSS